jgi:hypothetical protein
MKTEPLRLLRYNTGNDKKVFLNFKDDFDVVIFNATIVAFSGSAIADIVSIHKNRYIIDPQTHIFQHDKSLLQSLKQTENKIKPSIGKYLSELPSTISDILLYNNRPITANDILKSINQLVEKATLFQIDYVQNLIKNKDYEKYLDFLQLRPKPFLVISPYFMLKKEYTFQENSEWLKINRLCLEETINQTTKMSIAAQLVIDKDILIDDVYLSKIIDTYNFAGFDYIFIWVDDFSTFFSDEKSVKGFRNLVSELNKINKKVLMTYGGYDSILLSNSTSKYKICGVAQSIGYGESRSITPVGGGLPINKYYFPPLHKRLKFHEAAYLLRKFGYFDKSEKEEIYVNRYFENICDCRQCRQIIRNSIEDFNSYNDSIPFEINSKNGILKRNRPTTEATFISSMHFLYRKVNEWKSTKELSFSELTSELLRDYDNYGSEIDQKKIDQWMNLYA